MDDQPPHPAASTPPKTRFDWFSRAARCCGFTSLLFPPLGIVALLLALLGLVRTRRERRQGRGSALTGLVIGSITTVGMAVIVGPVLLRTRDSARSVECVGQLRAIGTALRQYAAMNQGQYPPSLVVLAQSAGRTLQPTHLICPASDDRRWTTAPSDDEEARERGHLSYLYFGAGLLLSPDDRRVIAMDRHPHGLFGYRRDSLNVLYADGHVDTVSGDDAILLLQTLVSEGLLGDSEFAHFLELQSSASEFED